MPLAGIWEIYRPLFRVAPGHPNEALFRRGRSILNMPTSYYSISHHHLADHLIYLSSSSSFWFSLNSSYDHKFHLSKRLSMSPQDYEYLLMALDLASIHKQWGFSIKVMKWKVFLEHRFCTSKGTVPLKLQLTGWTIMPCQLVVVSSLVVLSCWNRRRQNP